MPVIQTTKPLKPRPKTDFYPTPYECALAGVKLWGHTRAPDVVLDPGAGLGVYGKAVKEAFPHAYVAGMEIDPQDRPQVYDEWLVGDYLTYPAHRGFDLIVGNPPYQLAEEFVRKSLELCVPGGEIIFLFRLEFLASSKRANGLFKEHPPVAVWPLAQRPSFTGNGKTNAMDYAYFHWIKGAHSDPIIYWLNWR